MSKTNVLPDLISEEVQPIQKRAQTPDAIAERNCGEPVYHHFIFQGDTHLVTPTATAQEFFQDIDAPHKEYALISECRASGLLCPSRAISRAADPTGTAFH
ncbi:hypothetical protein COLU111180_16460 [Cohnella lubricantis]|uniref:Uncharacterized protein n=1 Tax=Cohnella lubricantis TaxID=2163172 RepID=A0A841T7Y9_9BACL|nr:hypothetical protein [Cohnella lubricantis]MBB6677032.1 hypothetical protein [Cohnella lubricantis]MBP2119298.1 hypothetical protein [Cohnella lubricantis]